MKKGSLPISLTMVVFNEERLLERAIKSCLDLVDDIVIVHDGKCGDNTLAIARKYTKKVFTRDHVGVAEPHRPFSYKKAKNEWILQLDADEYLSSELQENIGKLIKRESDIYQFSWPIKYGDRQYNGLYKTTLFKKSKVYLLGCVHEYPKPMDKNIKIEKRDYQLKHDPEYNNFSGFILKTKWLRWARLQAKLYCTNFQNIAKWNYKYNFWDEPTRSRIKHPIINGIILTVIYHIFKGIKDVVRTRSLFYLKHELIISLYFTYCFWYYIKLDKSLRSN